MRTKYPKVKDASKLYHYRALVTKVTDLIQELKDNGF